MKAQFIGLRKVIHAKRATSRAPLRVVSRKSIEWEGLTLRREPTEIERLCIKSIAQAQDDGKAELSKLLISAREEMIKGAVDGLEKLSAPDYHTLVVEIPKSVKRAVAKRCAGIYARGRTDVRRELAEQQKAESAFIYLKRTDEEMDELDELADLTLSRVANDVQARATSQALQLAAAGIVANEFRKRLSDSLDSLSFAPQEQAAGMAANRALAMGRSDEMEARKDEIERYLYSAILDKSVCDVCEVADGEEASSPDELPPAPNDSCLGGDQCRCFIVAVIK
jgi:hypothetical protein